MQIRNIRRFIQSLLIGSSILSINISSAQSGAALDFDGVNDYVSIPHNNLMNVSKVTIEAWVKWGNSGTTMNFICGKGNEQLEIQTGGGGGSNGIRFIPTPGVYLDGPANILPTNTWTHIAYVYDPSNALAKLYVNGIEKTLTNHGSNPLTTPISTSATSFNIGRRSNNSSFFKGQQDEFRVWNRVLTKLEIQVHMNCEFSGIQNGLLAYYKFNQGLAAGANSTITTLADSSGSNLNGTLSNFNLTGNVSNWVTPGGLQTGNHCGIPTSPTYTFIGSGNWSDSSNWSNHLLPPALIPDSSVIVINPITNGECVINLPVVIPPTVDFRLPAGKKLKVLGDVIVHPDSTIKLKENVRVVDSSIMPLNSTAAMLDQGIYQFTLPSSIPTFNVADILIGSTGTGYIRKITSYSQSSNTITFQTSQASMEDVFKQGFFNFGLTTDSSFQKTSSNGFSYPFTDITLIQSGGLSLKLNNGNITLDPDWAFDFNFADSKLDFFQIGCQNASLTSSFELNLTGTQATTISERIDTLNKDHPLQKRYTKLINVYGVPVPL